MSEENVVWIPWDEYDPSELEGEDAIIPEGTHRVRVTRVHKPKDKDYLQVHYKVLASEKPAAVGLTAHEKFHLGSNGAVKRLAILAKRLGWMDRGSGNKQTAGRMDFSGLVGRELTVQTQVDTYQDARGKERRKTTWGFASFWPIEEAGEGTKKAPPQPNGSRRAEAAPSDFV